MAGDVLIAAGAALAAFGILGIALRALRRSRPAGGGET